MTELECRIKYKHETGECPTYGTYRTGNCNFEGSLTNAYAKWLEAQDGGDMWKDDEYFKSSAIHGTYVKTIYGRKETIYTKDYKEWLERLECQKPSEM